MNDPYSFLRKVPLFSDLPEHDLERVCERVEEVRLASGQMLFEEGDAGDRFYIIKEGQIEIFKISNGREVLLNIRQAGEVIGELSLLEAVPRTASGRALTDSLLLAVGTEQLDYLLNNSPSAARTMISTVTSRLRTTEMSVRQNEKLAQLGEFTAGIAHELNNPAAAVQRGAGQLKSAFAAFQAAAAALNGLGLSAEQSRRLQALGEQAQQRALAPADLPALERSDRVAGLEEWLDERGIPEAWELATGLVDQGIDAPGLDGLAQAYPPAALGPLLRWLASGYSVYRLLDEIAQGAGSLSEIVKALKTYVYLDQAPVQEVNVHESIDNTLVILRHKLKQGIEVRREYDPAVPRIQAYGSELNQVWTNIIDNAADALLGEDAPPGEDGQPGNDGAAPNPQLTIRTAYKDPWVVVEIEDNGPGIPPEAQGKLFNPFFTTKPVGKGTGMGLNISYNIIHKHGGDVKVTSQPGKTRFEVWLPVDFKQVRAGGPALQPIHRGDDNSLRHILEKTRTIAVVGISANPERPAYTIPAYLQRQGYSLLPVNPNLREVLGLKAYPSLLDVPRPVDLVLIFRASESVPPIVDQAIAVGAKVVWMQEGIANEAAAQKASQAGLEVVMDTCIRITHRRLIGEKAE